MANTKSITRYEFVNAPKHRNIWSSWRTAVDAIEWAKKVCDIEAAALQEDWLNLEAINKPKTWYLIIYSYVNFGERYW